MMKGWDLLWSGDWSSYLINRVFSYFPPLLILFPLPLMQSFRQVYSIFMNRDLDQHDALFSRLENSDIPVTEADCRVCPNPCDEGHETYPNRFDVDMDAQMLGSVKPYRRQVVISTGKSDWDREITEAKGTLAAYLLEAQNAAQLDIKPPTPIQTNTKPVRNPVSGVFRSSDSSRISILNGSHESISHDPDLETVLVFPDYKVVTDVSCSAIGAENLWEAAVDPNVGRAGGLLEKSPFKSWTIPYSCVILLCSHKRRDKRCSIAAPKLEHTFIQCLQDRGWIADTQLEDPSCMMGCPHEDFLETPQETDERIVKQLKEASASNKALILRNSHIGGHRFAGNCIIYTPQGSSIWYGRVTPHEVESIVTNTIIGGMILPSLLRGGLNITRPGCRTLHEW